MTNTETGMHWFIKDKSTSPKTITLYIMLYEKNYDDYIDVYGAKYVSDTCYQWNEFTRLNYCNRERIIEDYFLMGSAFTGLYSYIASNLLWTDSDLDSFGRGCIIVNHCNSTYGSCLSCSTKSNAFVVAGFASDKSTTIPDALSELTATPNDGGVTITFNRPTNVGVIYMFLYELYKDTTKIADGFLTSSTTEVDQEYRLKNLMSDTQHTLYLKPMSRSLVTRSTWQSVSFTPTGCSRPSCSFTVI